MRRHVQTVAPYAWHVLFPARPPASTPWQTTLIDPALGPLVLTGELRTTPAARDLYLLVHGLGGATDSLYCRRGAAAVAAIGQASLSLSLRGADRLGEDFYNIALVDDLHAAVASPELAHFERIFVIGYSMGGYVTMHFARDPKDARVQGCAAICTPIDLKEAQLAIDSPRAWVYRRHVLGGLIGIYEAVARRRPVPTLASLVRKVRTMHEWDRLTIAPRYGYDGPEHYYSALSIAPHLGDLEVPTLHVASRRDPIVPPRTIENALARAAAPYELRWVDDGGHVNFTRRFDLGFAGELGLERQLFAWFASVSSRP